MVGVVGVVGVVMAVLPCRAVQAAKGLETARSQGCMGCHALDQKVLGPAFVDVARRYASDAAAVEKLAQRIAGGSSGVWGAVAMPAQPQLKADEATSLARWVMGLDGDKP